MSISVTKNDPNVIKSWAMYDWANSAYNLVITTTIFPVYYTSISRAITGEENGMIDFLGLSVKSSSLINYTLAFAYLMVAFASPILSCIADSRGNKKTWLKFFTYVGSFSCCLMYFFTAETLSMSMIFFGMAAIGFTGSLVFYNSYLPEIATPDKQDAVSAKGYAYGYIGSVILQIICLILVSSPQKFGLSDAGVAARVSFLLTGLWWVGFAQIPFKRLSQGVPNSDEGGTFVTGLTKVLSHLKEAPALRLFLSAYFFYILGVNTIMLVAAVFGAYEIKMDSSSLILTILLIQIVAIFGARLMASMSSKFGNIKVLIFAVVLWILVAVFGSQVTTKAGFYLLAAMVGLVMGGIQSLSRSTYSKLLPVGTKDTTSFFSFFDVTEKIAIALGLFLFATIDQMVNMRVSALSLSILFAIGLILLFVMWFKYPQSRLFTTKSSE